MAAPTTGRTQQRSLATRRALVDAAIEILRRDGFGAATARTIAARAGCNQGLVFYHFGSVVDLLLTALDDVSERRRARFDAALAQVRSPGELIELATAVFREDVDNGDAAVLAEMVAACSATPGLGPRVKARMTAWTQFAVAAVDRVLAGSPMEDAVPRAEIAHAIVALYLGLELLAHLDGDRAPAVALFDRMRQLAGAADLLFSGRTARAAPPPRSGNGPGGSGRHGREERR